MFLTNPDTIRAKYQVNTNLNMCMLMNKLSYFHSLMVMGQITNFAILPNLQIKREIQFNRFSIFQTTVHKGEHSI
ncbi:hypothetical protein C1885_20970 [Pseudomonas sp. GW531-R1]|nr:hypothetical protein C1885_20970 [Pseudomonas sp. GW531-R1]